MESHQDRLTPADGGRTPPLVADARRHREREEPEMIIITPARIKAIVADCKTDADLVSNLRYHKIRYRYTTETGFLSVVIPCSTCNKCKSSSH